MHYELKYGKWKYLLFVITDILCIALSNQLALWIYLYNKNISYGFRSHIPIMLEMVIIDLFVTVLFSSLRRVLRWRKRREVYESARHIFFSFIILGLFLFITKSGADYSRMVVFIAYGIDYVLILLSRTVLRYILTRCCKKPGTTLLMTTDRFVDEGIQELNDLKYEVKHLYLLKNINKETINGIPVAQNVKEAASIICWDMIDNVYIYGLDHQMVPEYLRIACKEMKINFELVDFNYRVVDVKTITHEDPKYGSLTFLEGERDIPFPIRRVYWITETEAELHRGFHAHKLNCQLLYCPYGKIDLILDDGENKTTVTLDRPGKGLIIMPGLWREMVWRENGSVLCVLASEYYDANEYIRDYDEFIAYSKKYRGEA